MPRLAHLGVDAKTLHALESVQVPVLTVESFLSRDEEQIKRETGIPFQVLSELRYRLALKLLPPRMAAHQRLQDIDTLQNPGLVGGLFDNALQAYHHQVSGTLNISTGAPSLDLLLGSRGFATQTVTELVGPSCSGKTQICLSAAVMAAASRGGVVYMDTGNSVNPRRIHQIIVEKFGKENSDMVTEMMSRVKVMSVFRLFDALDALNSLEQGLTSGDPAYQDVRLVVVDSIKSLISPLLGGDEKEAHGHGLMSLLARTLNYMAIKYSLAVVVVNSTVQHRTPRGETQLKAALGASWPYFPAVRVMLKGDGGGDQQHHYEAILLKHPHKDVAGQQASFTIGRCGVEELTM